MVTLTILIGLSGSGKSTYTKQFDYKRIFFSSVQTLSSDKIRKELLGSEEDQSNNELIFSTIKERASYFLENKIDVIIDATNITRKSREDILNYLAKNIYNFYDKVFVKYVIIATPYYQCLQNNAQRERRVPESVIERQYKIFEFPTQRELNNWDAELEIVFPYGIPDYYKEGDKNYLNHLNMPHDNPHHSLSIEGHSLKALELMCYISDSKVMQLAARLHDVGKPFCKNIKEDGIATYYNHSNVGSYEAIFYGAAEKLDERKIIELCTLIEYHMQIRDCTNEKSKQKLISRIGNKMYIELKVLNLVDEEAH